MKKSCEKVCNVELGNIRKDQTEARLLRGGHQDLGREGAAWKHKNMERKKASSQKMASNIKTLFQGAAEADLCSPPLDSL